MRIVLYGLALILMVGVAVGCEKAGRETQEQTLNKARIQDLLQKLEAATTGSGGTSVNLTPPTPGNQPPAAILSVQGTVIDPQIPYVTLPGRTLRGNVLAVRDRDGHPLNRDVGITAPKDLEVTLALSPNDPQPQNPQEADIEDLFDFEIVVADAIQPGTYDISFDVADAPPAGTSPAHIVATMRVAVPEPEAPPVAGPQPNTPPEITVFYQGNALGNGSKISLPITGLPIPGFEVRIKDAQCDPLKQQLDVLATDPHITNGILQFTMKEGYPTPCITGQKDHNLDFLLTILDPPEEARRINTDSNPYRVLFGTAETAQADGGALQESTFVLFFDFYRP